MKKFLLFFILACLACTVHSQVLFSYGSNTVSKDEFLRAYNKNKTAVTSKEMALREYLDLYIKFRLKVKAAKDMHIDTLASLANDLQNFRAQIEESYLNDEARVNALVQEANSRGRKDIHVAYLFFPSKDFKDSVSVEQHHTLSKTSWTDVGYITVFNLPYEFENIVYALKPGEESHPYRAKNGFYIFKNIEERNAVGKIKAAQIMIAVPEGGKAEDDIAAKKLADSLYKALLAGADFGEVAKKFSNDQMSYMMGGQLPEFGIGNYDPEFENRVFSISKDGEIVAPFRTKFGYHIIKRLSRSPIPEDANNESYLYTLKQQVMQDNRITSAKDKFVNDVLKKLNYKKSVAVKDVALWKMTDSFTVTGKAPGPYNAQTVLFSLENKNVKVSDWFAFIKNYNTTFPGQGESDEVLMKKFIAKTALEIYKKRLPDFNPEFKYQLQEFKDGNMLFEVMERNVWNKASGDSMGLKNYYQQNKTKYSWNESADAILISCSDLKTAIAAANQARKGKDWRQISEEYPSKVQTDSGRYELTQIPAAANTKFVEGMTTDPLENENDGTATFVQIIKIYPARQQRSFEEARGLVINDYQGYLEEKWIEQLKKKYPVKINEKVFQSML